MLDSIQRLLNAHMLEWAVIILAIHSVLLCVWAVNMLRLASQLSEVRTQILMQSLDADDNGFAQNSIHNGSSPGTSVRLKSGSEAAK